MRTGSTSHIMSPQAHLITSDPPPLAHSSEGLTTPALPQSGFGGGDITYLKASWSCHELFEGKRLCPYFCNSPPAPSHRHLATTASDAYHKVSTWV